MPDGSKAPALKFTPRADVDLLEKQLKRSIYEKTPPNTNTTRTAELAFRALDTDGSGGVNLDEFIKALDRFGMHVAGMRKGLGGLPRDTVQALFNKYDSDGSGACRGCATPSNARAATTISSGFVGRHRVVCRI